MHMLFVWVIVKHDEKGHTVLAVTTNKPAADLNLARLERAAQDPESEHYGAAGFEIQRHFNQVDIFDLWAAIREHPAYMFGSLFVAADFDRGIPQRFTTDDGEQTLVDAGQGYIDGLYTGEPARHRLRDRLRGR